MIRRLSLVIFIMLAALVSTEARAGKSDDTIRAAFGIELPSLDPYYIGGNEGAEYGRLVFDALIYRDPVTFEFKPLLATAWRMIDDTTWEFDLREGVKFQNGDDFTAEDVVYTMNFASNHANGTFSPQYADWIASVEALGPYKVRIHAAKPTPTALEFIRNIWILPAKYHQTVGKEKFGLAPVATGPYKAERGPGNTVILSRNENYYDGGGKNKPYIKTLVYTPVPDVNTQIAELISGGIDWAWYIPQDQAAPLASMPNLTLVNAPTFRIAFITMDALGLSSPDSPLKDIRVRQAINYAIDKASMAKTLVGSSSQPIPSSCSPSQLGCTSDVTTYDYDPARAKSLLAEAGYPNGFAIDIYGYRSHPVADAIIGYLSAVGIKANLHWLQYPAVIKARHDHQTPMVIDDFGSGGINDVGFMMRFFFNGSADDQSNDPEVNAAISKGSTTVDDDQRRATYETAIKRIAAQAYWVPLFTMPMNFAESSDLVTTPTNDESVEFWRFQWKQ